MEWHKIAHTYIVGFLNLTTLLLHQNRVSDSPIKYPQLFDDHEILKLLHGTTIHTLLSPYIVFSFHSLFLVVIPPLPPPSRLEPFLPSSPSPVGPSALLGLSPSARSHVTLSICNEYRIAWIVQRLYIYTILKYGTLQWRGGRKREVEMEVG